MSATSRAQRLRRISLLCLAALAPFLSARLLRADTTRSAAGAISPQIRSILLEGDPAPGLADGLTIRVIHGEPPIISPGGVALFAAFLDGEDITSHNDGVLYAARDGRKD